MSAKWTEDDEEFRIEGVKGSLKSKPRFSFNEVKLLLQAVKRNRYIILRKFNQGVSAEAKKQTWAEITDQVNSLGENHREVRQIMKKWADLKCDGKRRMAALRGPNGSNTRKKKLGPVERMVHKILMLSPQGGGDSDLEAADDEDLSKFYAKGPSANPSPYSYLSLTDNPHPLQGGASFELSPLSSSPEKELGGEPVHSSSDFDLADEADRVMDFEDNDDALFSSYPSSAPPPTSLDPLPDNVLTRVKPVHTYSRNSQNHTQNPTSSSSTRPPPGPSSSVASTSSDFPSVSDSDAAPPPSRSPSGSKVTVSSSSLAAPPSSLPPPSPASSSPSVAANDATSQPAASSTSIPPPPPASSSSVPSSNSHQPPPSSSALPPNQHPSTSGTNPSDPLPAGASTRRQPDQVAQMASQSLQQQRASRMLLTSVSQSLEVLAQSVQLLVESQQEFVQESLLLQRETVDILKDFSNTALTMLRDKSSSGQLTYHHPSSYF